MRALVHRILAALSVGILVGAIWLLSESRPQLSTIAGGGAERLLGFVAWLGGLVLAAGLLFRVVGRERRQTVASLPIRNLHRREARKPRGQLGGYADRAFQLIPKAGPADAAVGCPSVEIAESPLTPVDEHAPPVADSRAAKAVISLLGPLAVAVAPRRGRGLRGATRELLCYLALRPGGAYRDQIIDALWPDQTPEHARNRLWRAAADARAQLGETSLNRNGEHYVLNRSEVTVDVDRLEQLLAELSRREETKAQLPLLEQALALFSGEPLAGSDYPWAENEQRRLQAIRLDLFERTAHTLLANGDPAGALSRAEEALSSEPYNEKLARLAMQAEAALGLRKAVVHRYERLSEILEEQLGLQPHVETRRLYRQLLGQDHDHNPLPATRS
jgi:DNA-binding SARP family transcriptional activator